MAVQCRIESRRTSNDIRFARELTTRFDYFRGLALRGEPSQAADALEMLQTPPGSPRFENMVADFVERERAATVREIIAYLRLKTGKDFGEDPHKWIEAVKRTSEKPEVR